MPPLPSMLQLELELSATTAPLAPMTMLWRKRGHHHDTSLHGLLFLSPSGPTIIFARPEFTCHEVLEFGDISETALARFPNVSMFSSSGALLSPSEVTGSIRDVTDRRREAGINDRMNSGS